VCETCGERIDADAVDDHERAGHSVRGRVRPDRLLASDPWQVGEEAGASETDGTGTGDPDSGGEAGDPGGGR
jgi:hypothetical protein